MTPPRRELVARRAPSSGDDAFMLHDTYGFPIELTEEIARRARRRAVDREGFERAMDAQRTRARAASKFEQGGERGARPGRTSRPGPDSEFLGYDASRAEGVTLRRWRAARRRASSSWCSTARPSTPNRAARSRITAGSRAWRPAPS